MDTRSRFLLIGHRTAIWLVQYSPGGPGSHRGLIRSTVLRCIAIIYYNLYQYIYLQRFGSLNRNDFEKIVPKFIIASGSHIHYTSTRIVYFDVSPRDNIAELVMMIVAQSHIPFIIKWYKCIIYRIRKRNTRWSSFAIIARSYLYPKRQRV